MFYVVVAGDAAQIRGLQQAGMLLSGWTSRVTVSSLQVATGPQDAIGTVSKLAQLDSSCPSQASQSGTGMARVMQAQTQGLLRVRTWKLPLRRSYLMRLFLSSNTAAECARSRRRSSSRLSVCACSLGTPYSCVAKCRARAAARCCALHTDACQCYLGIC